MAEEPPRILMKGNEIFMEKSDFYYDLPKELIAQDPLEQRDASRLLYMDRVTGRYEDHTFRDVTDWLNPGDTLVINDTKVIPARLLGVKAETGAHVEILLLRRLTDTEWETLVRPGKKMRPGTLVVFGEKDPSTGKYPLTAYVEDILDEGNRKVRFEFDGVFEEILSQLGEMPHQLKDKDRYNTVYAKYNGSAAAPTAGLHFTKELLEEIREKGVNIAHVTLHVGLGTFRPVKTENIEDHHMHSEFYIVSEETAKLLNDTKASGHKVICVGTTSCRTVESATDENGIIHAGSSWTSIFIYPGYHFKMMDGLITNFHLPESTLVMLVSAFAGREHILNAYKHAVEERYRFFSFGDAMLLI